MDCGNMSSLFIDQLRRKNVEGMLNHKHASMDSIGLVALVGRDEKMKVSNGFIEEKSAERPLRIEGVAANEKQRSA
jgi:hypothetical protein